MDHVDLAVHMSMIRRLKHTGDNRRTQLVASSFKMASIRVRCIRRGPVQRVPDSVATRISIKYFGMHKQHIGIVFPGENKYSMHRKLPRIAQQGATAFCVGATWRN